MTKNVFLLFFLFCIKSNLLAQSSSFEESLSIAHHGRSNKDSALFWANRAYTLAQKDASGKNLKRALVYVAAAFYNRHQRDTAVILLNGVLPTMNQNSFEYGVGLWYLAKTHLRKAAYDHAKESYLIAKNVFEKCDSTLYVSYCLSEIGLSEGMQGNYSAALEWFTKSYENKLVNGLENTTGMDLHNIANVYMRQGSYDKAIVYYRKSIKLKEGSVDHGAYMGIGGAYNLQGMSDSAQYYYKKTYDLAVEAEDEELQATASINLSNIYFQDKQYHLAIQYLHKARTSRGLHARSVPPVYTELGKNYFGLQLLDSAKYFLELGFIEAQRVNSRQYMAEASEFLSLVYAALNDFEEAYAYARMSIVHSDSINKERRNDVITDQRVKLETLSKQHEIDNLSKENEIQQYKLTSIITGVSSLAIIAFLGFLNFRSRSHLKQKDLENEKAALRLELDKKVAQLSAHTLHMIHHKNGLEEIEQHLANMDGAGKQRIQNVISINKAQEKDWDNFNTYFSEVHAQFFEILSSYHSDLSQSEVRLCALIRMNLANNEIATLLNIEPKSVKMARYRLKKKMRLEEDQDLNNYIQKMGSTVQTVG